MSRRERGATVGVMWVIILIVVLLGAGGWIYSRESDIQTERDRAAAAEQDRETLSEQLVATNQRVIDLSAVVGFRAGGEQASSVAAVQDKLSEIRGRFPNDLSATDDKTLQDVMDRLVAMVDARDQIARNAEQSFQTEKSKREATEASRNEIEQTLTGQVAQVNTDLNDERERASSAQQQADSRATGLQDQIDEANARLRTMESEFSQERATIQRTKEQSDARVADLSRKVDLIGIDDLPGDPDGKVVAAGETSGVVYLDIGSGDLLRRGVRFDVSRYAKGGTLVPKGLVEVREVFADYSIAGIVEQLNPLDPIAPGDVVANPHFSRDREKVFVLLGNFPVHGKAFLQKRLTDLGAEVADTVSTRVDFLVLGEREPGEDATELTDTEEYKMARDLGVQVLRARDLTRFIQP